MSDFNNNISNSGGPGSSAEPSMEEILASIRRILKEDTSTPAKVDIDDDVLVLDDSMLAKPVDFSSATELPPEPELVAPHPDAAGAMYHEAQHFSSEPTFQVQDYGGDTQSAYMADDVPAYREQDEYARQPEYEEPPAPEQTEPNAPPKPAQPEPAQPEPAQFAPAQSEPAQFAPAQPEPAQLEPAQLEPAHTEPAQPEHNTPTEPTAQPEHSEQPEDQMPENVEPPHGIMSEDASNAAANSIGALVRSISADRSVAVSRGGVTIEDIVREEIRPVLKAWLDTHLPSLVERLVRSEIERVVSRGAS